MARNAAGEAVSGPLRLEFDRSVKVEFRGSAISSDGGLLLHRELDDALGLSDMAAGQLSDMRTGLNGRHRVPGFLRQSVFSRLAGYEDVNDADRLCRDPVMRQLVGGRAIKDGAASASAMGRFETEMLTQPENLAALVDLSPPRCRATLHHRRLINGGKNRKPIVNEWLFIHKNSAESTPFDIGKIMPLLPRKFFEQEVAPFHREWEDAGVAPDPVWKKAGEAGLLCVTLPEEYGAAGADRIASAILIEEQARLGLSGPGFFTHSDIVAPYILSYGTQAQKDKWLPKMVTGELIGAIVLTEPGAGSDLRSIRTSFTRDGEGIILNGSKTFITNGQCGGIMVVAAKSSDATNSKELTLVVVESATAGVSKGENFKKAGMKAQDTCEIFFDNVRLPASNILGEEGKGFRLLSKELACERLQIAIGAVATSAAALDR